MQDEAITSSNSTVHFSLTCDGLSCVVKEIHHYVSEYRRRDLMSEEADDLLILVPRILKLLMGNTASEVR